MGVALDGVTGWVLFGGLTLVIGAVAVRWLILPRCGADGPRAVSTHAGQAARLGVAGAGLLFVGLLAFFARQLLEFRDPSAPWSEEAGLLLATPWGRVWLRAVVGGVLLIVAFAMARRLEWGWWFASPLALALGAFPAFTGHAAASGEFRSLFVLADTFHVWAASAWIGSLAAILWLEASHDREPPAASILPSLVPAFSPVAMASVATLVATGGLASWGQLESFSTLFTSDWGRLLLTKLAVVAIVLGFGARNFRVLTPRLGTPAGDRDMRRSALIELAIAQIVLIVTALLVRTSPLGG